MCVARTRFHAHGAFLIPLLRTAPWLIYDPGSGVSPDKRASLVSTSVRLQRIAVVKQRALTVAGAVSAHDHAAGAGDLPEGYVVDAHRRPSRPPLAPHAPGQD